MPELWKALGDVYGETGNPARPTMVQPAQVVTATPASTDQPLDDDLAAALSAALATPQAEATTRPAPVKPRMPSVSAALTAVTREPAPAPAPAPAPEAVAPVAPAPVAAPTG